MLTTEWKVWSGYAFEALCLKHKEQIAQKLKIPGSSFVYSWRVASNDLPYENEEISGAQIDLLFDRDDDAISICEIKYMQKPYVITKDELAKLNKKIAVFRSATKTKKQIMLSLIVANGAKENQYSKEIVTGIVLLEDLFEK